MALGDTIVPREGEGPHSGAKVMGKTRERQQIKAEWDKVGRHMTGPPRRSA
jgi:hypothetical protein